VTEVGYSYLHAVQTKPQVAYELGGAYEEGAPSQAKYLTDTLGALARHPNVIGINWTFLISATDNPVQQDAGLGLTDVNWQPEPSFAAYQEIAKRG
jgi:hypothetical protein